MKKMLTGLFVAIMMVSGLVAFSSTSATAACPYTGCVKTFTKIDAPKKVKRFDSARIGVKVTTNGNGVPVGRVTLVVERSKGGFKFVDTKKYDGGKVFFRTPDLNRLGKYDVTAKFDGKAGSAYKDSADRDKFKVVRR